MVVFLYFKKLNHEVWTQFLMIRVLYLPQICLLIAQHRDKKNNLLSGIKLSALNEGLKMVYKLAKARKGTSLSFLQCTHMTFKLVRSCQVVFNWLLWIKQITLKKASICRVSAMTLQVLTGSEQRGWLGSTCHLGESPHTCILWLKTLLNHYLGILPVFTGRGNSILFIFTCNSQ